MLVAAAGAAPAGVVAGAAAELALALAVVEAAAAVVGVGIEAGTAMEARVTKVRAADDVDDVVAAATGLVLAWLVHGGRVTGWGCLGTVVGTGAAGQATAALDLAALAGGWRGGHGCTGVGAGAGACDCNSDGDNNDDDEDDGFSDDDDDGDGAMRGRELFLEMELAAFVTWVALGGLTDSALEGLASAFWTSRGSNLAGINLYATTGASVAGAGST